MQILFTVIFALELALLFVHEMDAIRRQEWKMFVILKDMKEEKAYAVFTLLHIPLYGAILYLLLSPNVLIGFYIIDAFLIAHTIIHFMFGKNPANRFTGKISKTIICVSGAFALVHLIYIAIS